MIEDVSDAWIDQAAPLVARIGDELAWHAPVVVFEGAQGVLLDQTHGFHPHTTWSDCTVTPALELIPSSAEVRTIGVLRTFAVRHGAGPLPTECDLPHPPAEHNVTNEWQGAVRRGWFDAVLARYAIDVAGPVDALAITHLDWLSHLTEWTYCDACADARPVLSQCPADAREVIERIESLTGKCVTIASRGPTAADVSVTSDAHAPSAAPPAAHRRSR